MSTPRVRQQRVQKPPACDSCKARRVLCHPQPSGAPCPRCAEKGYMCKTTRVARGRPRKNGSAAKSQVKDAEKTPLQQLAQPPSSSMSLLSPQVLNSLEQSPELTPQLVAHFFECFDHLPQSLNLLIRSTSINTSIRSVSFQLNLLTPQLRILALCISAYASLISFDEAVLGPGPRPQSLFDAPFFATPGNVRSCGTRRSPACRALHAGALRAAWDAGIMLHVSNENAASCFLLDYLEQTDFSGLSRPWASAYISHVRALAPLWPASSGARGTSEWAGTLMAESLLSTRHRKPILITLEDQILLSGPEPPPMDTLLSFLEASKEKSHIKVINQSMRPYMFHVTSLARIFWQQVTGDHARLSPLPESTIINLLASLSTVQAITSHLLAHADAYILLVDPPAPLPSAFHISHVSDGNISVRACIYGVIMGFVGLALPFYRELELRWGPNASISDSENSEGHLQGSEGIKRAGIAMAEHTRVRMRASVAHARELAGSATSMFARAIRLVPAVHYLPVRFRTLRDCAQFALEDAYAAAVLDGERIRDLTTIVGHLKMTGYFIDLAASAGVENLIAQLEVYITSATAPGPMGTTTSETSTFFDERRLFTDLLMIPPPPNPSVWDVDPIMDLNVGYG